MGEDMKRLDALLEVEPTGQFTHGDNGKLIEMIAPRYHRLTDKQVMIECARAIIDVLERRG
jgi:hypothetical protein